MYWVVICEHFHTFGDCLHWCWVTENIYCVLNIRGHIIVWNLHMNRCSVIQVIFGESTKVSVYTFWLFHTFGLLQKMTCLHWKIYSWQGFNSIGCPLMLRTNNRCVQSLNISVDDAKCVENVQKFTQYTHFCPYQEKTCPDWIIYS